jgi:hypothetical protein
MNIPWYFLWSERYGVFCDILTGLVSDKYFNLYPIEKPQELFNNTTYKKDLHFLCGMYLKDYEIMKLLEVIPENQYFIFSDVDLVVEEEALYNYLTPFMEKGIDMMFMKENDDVVNVGFMVIKNSTHTKNLFNSVMKVLNENANLLDQSVINNALKGWEGTYEVLSPKYITSNVNIDIRKKENTESICVFQPLCTAFKNYRLNILEKLISFKYLFNVNTDEHIDELISELDDEGKITIKQIINLYRSTSLNSES